jgi:hypothetical protein
MVMVKEILKLVRITVQTTKKLSIGAARKQSVPNTNKQLFSLTAPLFLTSSE